MIAYASSTLSVPMNAPPSKDNSTEARLGVKYASELDHIGDPDITLHPIDVHPAAHYDVHSQWKGGTLRTSSS